MVLPTTFKKSGADNVVKSLYFSPAKNAATVNAQPSSNSFTILSLFLTLYSFSKLIKSKPVNVSKSKSNSFTTFSPNLYSFPNTILILSS